MKFACSSSRGRSPAPEGVRAEPAGEVVGEVQLPSRRIWSTLAGSCSSAKLGSVAEARPPGRFEEMLPEVESQLDPRRVTPFTNLGWGVFYTQQV